MPAAAEPLCHLEGHQAAHRVADEVVGPGRLAIQQHREVVAGQFVDLLEGGLIVVKARRLEPKDRPV